MQIQSVMEETMFTTSESRKYIYINSEDVDATTILQFIWN